MIFIIGIFQLHCKSEHKQVKWNKNKRGMRIKVFKVTKTISSLRIFLIFYIYFFTKRFWAYKSSKQKTTNKTKISKFYEGESRLFFILVLFLRSKSLFFFFKKQTWNFPDNLEDSTTEVYPYQPPYGEFICIYLLFVRISFYSW